MTGRGPDDACGVRHRSEDVLQGAVPWDPELVGVGIDHPVRSVLVRRCARHASAPVAFAHLTALAKQLEHAAALVRLEDLERPVLGVVVCRDDVVDAGVEVVRDLRVDDVHLVAHYQRLHELHRAEATVLLL